MITTRDEQWFGSIFSKHGKAIVKFLYRRDAYTEAEDLTTETSVVPWRKRGEVPDSAELPWLYRTAGLTLPDWFRKKKSLPLRDATESLDSVDGNDPANLVMKNQGVRTVLAELSKRDRKIILTVAWEGLAGQVLADHLGASRNAVDTAPSRARKRLGEAIARNT